MLLRETKVLNASVQNPTQVGRYMEFYPLGGSRGFLTKSTSRRSSVVEVDQPVISIFL